jgi:hypothetical protein
MHVEINTKYLSENSLARFKEIESKVTDCYQHSLRCSPINFPGSEYLPKIYVVPFVRRVVLPDGEVFVFNEVLPDPYEAKYRAFFSSLPFLEIIEAKFITAIFAHELAHLMDFSINPNRDKELWEKNRGDARLTHQDIDQKASEYYKHFREPAKAWLYELDEQSNKIKIFEQVKKSNAEIREFKGIHEFPQYIESFK